MNKQKYKPGIASRQYKSMNVVSLAGRIVSDVSHGVTSDGRNKCSFFLETITKRFTDDGKSKEDKSQILCKAFDNEALRFEVAQKNSYIIASAQIIGVFVKREDGKEYYEQWTKIKEFSLFYEDSPDHTE